MEKRASDFPTHSTIFSAASCANGAVNGDNVRACPSNEFDVC
jgi:hypothetical protein